MDLHSKETSAGTSTVCAVGLIIKDGGAVQREGGRERRGKAQELVLNIHLPMNRHGHNVGLFYLLTMNG